MQQWVKKAVAGYLVANWTAVLTEDRTTVKKFDSWRAFYRHLFNEMDPFDLGEHLRDAEPPTAKALLEHTFTKDVPHVLRIDGYRSDSSETMGMGNPRGFQWMEPYEDDHYYVRVPEPSAPFYDWDRMERTLREKRARNDQPLTFLGEAEALETRSRAVQDMAKPHSIVVKYRRRIRPLYDNTRLLRGLFGFTE